MFRSKLAAIALACLAVCGIAHAGERDTITEIIEESGDGFDRNRFDYDMLLAALRATSLDEALDDEDARVTLFAPNDRAFIRLARDLGFEGRGEEDALNFLLGALAGLNDGDPLPVLKDVLLYHVVPERVSVFGFVVAVIRGTELPTLLGATVDPFFLGLEDNEPDLRDPRLFFPVNVRASNGIIHTLDRVLIPLDI